MSIDLSEETNELHQTIQDLMVEIAEHKRKISRLKEIHQIQGSNGNWDGSIYMTGMYNGLELALSILESREVNYRDCI